MDFQDINTFLAYYAKLKARTRSVLQVIPPAQIEWTYREGRFSLGDIIRHLANIERYMYAETVQGKPSAYRGCDESYAAGYEQVLAYYDRMHQEALGVFQQLQPNQLQQKCMTPAGIKITTWKWLRAMAEHEIHHRGQLYVYLGILGVVSPPVFGLTSEEVIERSKD